MAARRDKETIDKENAEPVVQKKKSGLLFYLMVLAGAVIAAGIVMGAVMYFVGIPGVIPKMKAPPPPVYETLEMGERVVNLNDPSAARYLRVRIVLEFKKDEKLAAEVKEKNAQVMEAILKVLRSKSVEDIKPLNKEEKVKSEIISAINANLKTGKIEKVYFTDFLIQ